METIRRIVCHALLFALIMPLVSLIFIAALGAAEDNDPHAFILRLIYQGKFELFLLAYVFGAPASLAAGTIVALFHSRIWSNLIMVAVSSTVLLLQLIALGPMYAPDNLLLYSFLTVLFSSLITRFIVRQRLFSFAH